MKRNLLLLLILFVVSVGVTLVFGDFISTNIFGPGGFEGFFIPREIVVFVNSFPFVYYFMAPFLFFSWGKGRKWVWIIGSLLPLVIVEIYIGAFSSLWSLSLTFFIAGTILSFITNYLVGKINPAK